MNRFQKESFHSLPQQMLHLEYFSFLPVRSWPESDPALYNAGPDIFLIIKKSLEQVRILHPINH